MTRSHNILLKSLLFTYALACPLAQADWNIVGAPDPISQAIRAYLLEEPLNCPVGAENTFIEHKPIQDALDAFGYFGAKYYITATPEKAPCTLNINLGTQATVLGWQTTFLDTEKTTPLMQRAQSLATPSNALFDPQSYRQTRRAFLNLLQEEGYIDANFARSDVVIDMAKNTAEIQWQVELGVRYSISQLIIEQEILTDELVRRILELEEGAPLRTQEMVEAYENLLSSDYYRRLSITPVLDAANNGAVPVHITAESANPWSYLLGPGYSTDSGPRFKAEASARYLNKNGHRASLVGLLSKANSFAKADYRWPAGNPNSEWYSIETQFNAEDTDSATSQTLAFGLKKTARLNKSWAQTTFANYSIEDFEIGTQESQSTLLVVGANFTYTSSIDTPRPRRGSRLSVDLRGAANALLSDNSFAQARLSGKRILPVFSQARLLLRAEFGAIWTSNFDALPASIRFFTGGDRSIRGYALDSVGSKDDFGNVIGSTHLINASVELDIPFRQNWSFALFSDIGSAYKNSPEFNQSIGAGVRWYSPLGPLRLDIARPMQDSNQSVRLHLSLGPDI